MGKTRDTANLISHNNLFAEIVNDRVGIGSTIPTSKLNVNGNVAITGSVTPDNYLITTASSTQASGATIQRVFSKTVAATELYKLAEFEDTEGDVAIEIQVSSETGAHSGTSIYRFQGGFSQLAGSYYRLYPFMDGRGHGDGPDTGLDSNAWNLFIYGTTVSGSSYRYGVAIHVPSGRSTKALIVTITELKRGMTFTDQSSSAVITSFTNSGNIYSHNNLIVGNRIGIGKVPTTTLDVSGNVLSSGQIQSTQANSTSDGGGQIYLNGATGNRIDFNVNGLSAPALTTRSTGTKIVLYPFVSASAVDYAFGIESNALWSSVPTTSQQFKWYAANTNIATLFGTGQFVLGSTSLTGTASQPLQVAGGAYFNNNIGVGVTNPTARMHLVLSGDTPNPVLQVTRANNSGGGVGNDEIGIAVTIPNTYNSAGTVYGVRSYVNHNLSGEHYAGHFVTAGGPYGTGIAVYAKTTHTDTNGPGYQPAIFADAYSNIGVTNAGYAVALKAQTNNYVNNVNLVLVSNYTGSLAQTLVRFERNGSSIGFITCSTSSVSYLTSSSSGIFGLDANTISVNTNSSERLRISSTGNIGIGTINPTSKLHVTGDVLVSGVVTSTDYNSTSDINLKENIKIIESPIEKILKIDGVSFNWKSNGNPSMGVIAQNVEEVFPELVNGNDPKTVNYNGLVGVLIEALKDQQKQINELKVEIQNLKSV